MDLALMYPCSSSCFDASATTCPNTDIGGCQCSATNAVKSFMCCAWSSCDASSWMSVKVYVMSYCQALGVNLNYLSSLQCSGSPGTSDTSTVLTSGGTNSGTNSGGSSSPSGSSTTNTSNNTSSGGTSSGLSGAMIGGIAGGVGAALLLGGFIVWLLMRRRHPRPPPPQYQQYQQYGALPQQPSPPPPSVPPGGPQMVNTGGMMPPPPGHTGGNGYAPVPTPPVNVVELSQTPALKPAGVVSTYPAPNSRQKPISAPIAPVSPSSPQVQPHRGAELGTHGHETGAWGHQQGGHILRTAELENNAPGLRELDGHTVWPTR